MPLYDHYADLANCGFSSYACFEDETVSCHVEGDIRPLQETKSGKSGPDWKVSKRGNIRSSFKHVNCRTCDSFRSMDFLALDLLCKSFPMNEKWMETLSPSRVKSVACDCYETNDSPSFCGAVIAAVGVIARCTVCVNSQAPFLSAAGKNLNYLI
jgi:hypothetical protein